MIRTVEHLVRTALRQLPAEIAHDIALRALRFLPSQGAETRDRLKTGLCGLPLAHPIGLAAGFDKDARSLDGLLAAGFAFVEAGTVTLRPQAGNPRPRLFRLAADEAIINRMGFNNRGLDAFTRAFSTFRALVPEAGGPVGANIGINKTSTDPLADYASGLRRISPLADYVTINISSPNTPGLRALQAADALRPLLDRIAHERKKDTPVLLKIAPDLGGEDIDVITDLVLEYGLDGMIVSNTTVSRPDGLCGSHRTETGGLSGRPLRPLALEALRRAAARAGGRIDLVGVGGIASGADVYERIRAGATAVQIYTAFVYQGPFAIARMLEELDALLRRDGFARLGDAIGADLRRGPAG